MTDPTDEPKTPSVHADHNSIAVGDISAGGDISGNIHIGNVYQTPEDDLPLSSDEIENGLTRFAQFLPERAPVLQDSFLSIAKKLRTTLGADQNSLSPALKAHREDGVNRMKLMCMEVTDISFRAMCLGQNPPPYDSRPPFLGLFAFRPEDREFFFGRDALIQKLVARIKAHPFLAVLGASGSGKSSLVMAGLVPALEAQMSYLTPSSAPLSQLLTAKEFASTKTVFVIDQFEELFTHPHDAERTNFIHALLELTKTNRVVITMRADFWGEVAIYSDLKQAMQEHQELIAPMTVDELHSAMEKQAAVVGLRFDPTLSESILAEVKGEPGAMPLLQHALWELWNRRHGLWIKAEEYQAFGGVKQAIASTAEEVYASCSDFERVRVRDIFLRLTRLDESGEGRDTRRRVLIDELIPVNSDSSVTIKLLNKLADARLIVKTDRDVEVAHEALIRHWSRLTEWLNEDRDNLRLREGVSESAREWENSKRDDSLLNHRGGRLELALAMSKLPRYQLNPIEQTYLNACVALKNKEQRERERRLRWAVTASIAAAVIFLILGSFGWVKSNEAIAQAGTAQANANVAATAQVNAETQKIEAEKQSQIALARQLAAQAQFIYSAEESKQATAILLATQSMKLFPSLEAWQILQKNTLALPISSMQYGEDISDVKISSDARYIVAGGCDFVTDYCHQGSIHVWDTTTNKETSLMVHSGRVTSLDISLNNTYVVSGSSDGTARLWNTITGKEIVKVVHANEPSSLSTEVFVDISPDGKKVVSGGCDSGYTICNEGSVRVWESLSGTEIAKVNYTGNVNSVAFTSTGKYVVSTGWDRIDEDDLYSDFRVSTLVWDPTTGKEILRIMDTDLYAIDQDEKNIAFVSNEGITHIWDIELKKEIANLANEGNINSIAFSPDGKYIASSACEKSAPDYLSCIQSSVSVFEWGIGGKVSTRIYENDVTRVVFSPYGDYILSEIIDIPNLYYRTAHLSEVTTGREIAFMDDAYSAVFSTDGKWITSAGSDGGVHLWDVAEREEISKVERFSFLFTEDSESINHNGMYIIYNGLYITTSGNAIIRLESDLPTSLSSAENKIIVLETETGNVISQLDYNGSISFVDFSANGEFILLIGCDKEDEGTNNCVKSSAHVWDLLTEIEIVHVDFKGQISSVATSEDDKFIVLMENSSTSQVLDLKTGKEIFSIAHDSTIYSVVFSPDGRYIASGGGDKMVRVWEVKTGKEVSHMLHEDEIFTFAFDPTSRTIVSSDSDGSVSMDANDQVKIWNIATGELITSNYFSSPGIENVSFSHDGGYILIINESEIEVLVATTGELATTLPHSHRVETAAFSPDGNYIISGGGWDSYTARVWDLTTGLEIARISHNSHVNSVKFSPDGKYALSMSNDGTIHAWIFRPEDLIFDVCSRLTRNFTASEWLEYVGDVRLYESTCSNLPVDPVILINIALDALSNFESPGHIQVAIDNVKDFMIKNSNNIIYDEEVDKFIIFAIENILLDNEKLKQGEISLYLSAINDAQSVGIKVEEKISFNELCWFGSLWGYANEVLEYCTLGVTIEPNNINIRDSRGLARALTADINGAIDDFQYFIDHSQDYDAAIIQKRKEWIIELKNGNNPFTPTLLDELKNEHSN